MRREPFPKSIKERSYSACLISLRNGNVDAFSADLAILYGYLGSNPDMHVSKELKIGNPIFYGIAFKKHKDDNGRDAQSREICIKAAQAVKGLVRSKQWDNYFSADLPAYKADFPDYQTQIQPTNQQIDDNSCR